LKRQNTPPAGPGRQCAGDGARRLIQRLATDLTNADRTERDAADRRHLIDMAAIY
jgi:hypothetical protein